MTDFAIILRSLRVRLFSTVVTMLSVAIAVALLLVILTMRHSGKRAFERGCGTMHLLVTGEASPLVGMLNNVFYANPPRKALAWSRYEQLAGQAPWAFAIPTEVGDSFRGFPLVATTPEFFTSFKPAINEPWQFASGAAFAQDFEVVLGADVARAANLSVGDTIYVTHGMPKGAGQIAGDVVRASDATQSGHAHEEHGHEDHAHAEHDDDEPSAAPHLHGEFGCKVVGVLAPSHTPHDRAVFCTLESSWILHAHDRRERAAVAAGSKEEVSRTARADLMPEDKKVTAVYLRLVTREGSDAPANLPQVFDQLRKDSTLTVSQPAQEVATLFRIVDQTNRVFVAIACVVIASSAVGILLALYNSMDQRRRQLAIMRVLGASKGRIFGFILTESAIIGLCGCAGGTLLALAGAWAAKGVLQQRLGIIIEPRTPPELLFIVIVSTLALACCAGLIPAIMAYRTSVAKDLRPAA